MKTGYFISALATLCALAIGCTKMTVGGDLAEVQLSQSTVTLPAKGGSAKIDVNATGEWTIKALTEDEAKWLSVDKMSGPAGTTTVTFTALAESAACNKTTLILTCAGAEQHIYVQQGVPTVSEVTCKEVNEGAKGATYRVTGICTSIAESATYGNWYISDGTTEQPLYIYGTKYNGQTKQAALEKLGVEVGDELTIEGPKDVYNGTVELVDVDVIKLVKSLCKVCNSPVAPKEGGNVDLKVIAKGGNLNIVPKADWIKIASTGIIPKQGKDPVDTTLVTLAISPNEGGPRNGEVELTSGSSTVSAAVSQEGSTTPINEVVVGQPCFVAGTITGFCAAGFIITDETGSILYYQKDFKNPNNYVVGDKVEVTCSEATTYNGALEVEPKNIKKEVKVGHEDVVYPAPQLMGRAAVEEYLANCDGVTAPCKYVKVCGKVSVSGSYYNIIFGDSEKQGSFYQPTDTQKALVENGKMYELTGYLIGYTKSSGVVKFANFLVMDAKELNPTKTFAEIIAAGAGDYSCEATVVAVGSNQVALTDGTEYMFMYNKAKNAVVGSKVLLNGPVTQYNGCWEWNDPAFYVSAKDVPVVHPTAVNMTAAEFDAYKSAPGVKYYKVVGTKGASGYDVTGDGFVINPYSNATINPGSVTLYGYSIGIKSNKMNFIVASVEQ